MALLELLSTMTTYGLILNCSCFFILLLYLILTVPFRDPPFIKYSGTANLTLLFVWVLTVL